MTPVDACALWSDPALVREEGTFEVVERIRDSSRDGLYLWRCTECGLLYAVDFREMEEWTDGVDAMCSTYVPVQDKAHLAALRDAEPGFKLAAQRPCIQWHTVAGRPERLRWVR